jgi:hypothetical protein
MQERLNMAQIIININPSGSIEWNTEGIDGFEVMGKMAEVIVDMNKYFIRDSLRPVLRTPPSRVCIEFDGVDSLAISYRPEGDPETALGMMSAALCGLAHEALGVDFDPLQAVLGAVTIPVNDRP